MKIIRVALDIPVDTLFDYQACDVSVSDVGFRVLVPFGRKNMVGIILEVQDDSSFPPEKLKRAIRVLRDIPPISADLLSLFHFCSRYYQHPLGEVAMNSLPSKLRLPDPVKFMEPLCYFLTDKGAAFVPPKRKKVMTGILSILKQNHFLEQGEIKKISPSALGCLEEMRALNLIEAREKPFDVSSSPKLNKEQNEALQSILRNCDYFNAFLLYGITGSGKTEVYLQSIEKIIAEKKQVLFLVPEINLTPQLENLFRIRFPHTEIISLHSGFGASQRVQNWLLAQSGKAQIVLGTRLAVFTPMPKLGLVIVDEEHDTSFKQQESLRYSARDVAIFRAKQQNIPIVLGSATPSLESLQNAKTGRYKMLRLNNRAIHGAVLPSISLIDTRKTRCTEGLSQDLINAISKRMNRKEQSLIFINRRGYSPVLKCRACSWDSRCKRCSSKLVLHLREKRLRCHYCGYEETPPVSCPSCGNLDLSPVGHGTQRIESALGGMFPAARILRVDKDSTRGKGSWPQMLDSIHRNEADILVGTQILSKGHDFPKLTLVGILNPDASFYSADFRATERLYSQLTQVSGRSGRADIAGEVLIQTEFPDHPLYLALKAHNYDSIAELLLSERKLAGFPPFIQQALLRAESPKLEDALSFLEKARKLAVSLNEGVTLYDPACANMVRLGGMERAQLLVQSASRPKLQAFLRKWRERLEKSKTVRWHLDVDPMEF